MPIYTTLIPGLPGGPLVTEYPIFINLVPARNTRQRPGIPARTPRRSVQHGSGNPNSTAKGEIAYIVNGADGRQASYHYSTDWNEAWVGVPLNEVTWQAADGAGPGNMNGFSNEMAENKAAWADTIKRDRMIFIAADLMGRTAARLGAVKPEQHWDFNYMAADRHDCPNFLRHTPGAWDRYVAQWHASRTDELARMNGGSSPEPQPAPEPAYATPVPITGLDPAKVVQVVDGSTFYRAGYKVKAIRDTPRLRYANAASESVGPIIKAGETFGIDYIFIADDGLPYAYSPWHTRIRAADIEAV